MKLKDLNNFLRSTKLNTSLLPNLMSWTDALAYVRKLPYGRNANRSDFSLVLSEGKGTCSSKHALLKSIAEENELEGIALILCLYKMTETNTPGIGTALSDNNLDCIPEAHCYLRVNGQRLDCTAPTSTIDRIADDILEEESIAPEQVVDYKVGVHKAFMKDWIIQQNLSFSFEEMWAIRESCIEALSKSNG